MLDRRTHEPIRYQRVSGSDKEPVGPEDVVKGYEYRKGRYVVLDTRDFERAAARKSSRMDIVQFSDPGDIDRRLYDKPYVIEPDRKAAKAYVLLRDALEKSGKAGIVRYVMHDRERIGVVSPGKRFLLLDELRYEDELRGDKELVPPGRAAYTRKELDLALSLIDSLSEPFDPRQFKDTYSDELRSIIAAKARGEAVAAARPAAALAPTAVSDILETLRRSLERESASR
jgi:DNA end-binding protein Ku